MSIFKHRHRKYFFITTLMVNTPLILMVVVVVVNRSIYVQSHHKYLFITTLMVTTPLMILSDHDPWLISRHKGRVVQHLASAMGFVPSGTSSLKFNSAVRDQVKVTVEVLII